MSLRPGAVAALRAGLRSRLTLVCAPAGYGKTCLVSHVLEQVRARHAWYRLDGLDRDPAVFLEGLVSAWRRLNPGFGSRLLRELRTRPEERPDDLQLAALFVKECEAGGSPACHLALVLDEYEHVAESEAFNEVLGYLLENAPRGLSVVVVTRFEPAFAYRRLVAAGEVTRLDADDLRFGAAQTADVLSHHAGCPVSRQVAQAVHTAAQGWPTSVVMAGSALRRLIEAGDTEALLSDPRLTQDVYSYLAEQVYQRTPARSRDFLLRTCCLTVITPELAAAVTSDPHAHQHLRRLVERGVFTFETRDGRGVCYHPLFRDFLQTRLVRERGASSLRLVQHATAAALEQSGEHARAVELLLDANDPREALDVVGRAGERILDDTQADTLRAWLQRIPSGVGRVHPWRAIIAAQVGIRDGEFDDALANLDEAAAVLRESGDGHGLYQALSVRECVLYWKGESEAAVAACRDALDHAQTDAQRVHSLLSLACAAADMRRWDLAEEALGRARRIESLAPEGEWVRRRTIQANVLYHQGRFEEALRIMPMKELGSASEALKFGAANTLGLLLLGVGRYAESLDALQRAERLVSSYGHEMGLAVVRDSLAQALLATGDDARALQCLRTARAMAASVGDETTVSFTLSHAATLYRRRLRLHDARPYAVEALNRVTLERDPYLYLNCRANLLFTDCLYGLNPSDEFGEIAEEATRRRLLFVASKALVFRALASYLAEDFEKAGGILHVALQTATALGHNHLLLQELGSRPKYVALYLAQAGLCEQGVTLLKVLANGGRHRDVLGLLGRLAPALAAAYSECIAPRGERTPCIPAGQTATQLVHPALTPRENEILGLMAQGLTNKELGQRLYLAPSTIKTHVNRIFRKLGVTSRVNAVLEYQRIAAQAEPETR